MGKSKGKADDSRAGKGGLKARFKFMSHFSLPKWLDRWPVPLSRSARSREKALTRQEIDQDLIDTLDD